MTPLQILYNSRISFVTYKKITLDFKHFSLLHLDTKSGFAVLVLKAFIKDSSDLASVSFRFFFFLFYFFNFLDCLFALVPGQFYI